MSLSKTQVDALRITQLADSYVAMIGHPIRLVIIKTIYDQRAVSWTEIANKIKELWPSVNPNTITFHLNKLLQHQIVNRGKDDKYRLAESVEDNPIMIQAIQKMKSEQTVK